MDLPRGDDGAQATRLNRYPTGLRMVLSVLKRTDLTDRGGRTLDKLVEVPNDKARQEYVANVVSSREERKRGWDESDEQRKVRPGIRICNVVRSLGEPEVVRRVRVA
jgi:hypothetical protein